MSVPLLPIRIESEWLLIHANLIQEILGAQPWLSIPHTRRELPGVVAWRGRAIPLVDLGALNYRGDDLTIGAVGNIILFVTGLLTSVLLLPAKAADATGTLWHWRELRHARRNAATTGVTQ